MRGPPHCPPILLIVITSFPSTTTSAFHHLALWLIGPSITCNLFSPVSSTCDQERRCVHKLSFPSSLVICQFLPETLKLEIA